MTQQHYDLLVIGGGSGGLAAAEKAAQHGIRVAVIEKSQLGGTCVNNGCVPKKIMWYAANTIKTFDHAKDYGIHSAVQEKNWQQLVNKRREYISDLNRYWAKYAHDLGITVIAGQAQFISNNCVVVNEKKYSADHIVIATGSSAKIPAIAGASLGISSDGFFNFNHQPSKVAIIGAGYIGVELSGILSAWGCDTTVIAMENQILKQFEPLISETMAEQMQADNIQLLCNEQVTELKKMPSGIQISCASGLSLAGFEHVIWAIGRQANTQDLNLSAAGVKTLANGAVAVDSYENTNIPGIYALGDVNDKKPLTPVAIAAGRRLIERLFLNQTNSKVDYENIPSVVFSHPAIGTVGLTEQQARQHYGDDAISVYESKFVPMRYALSTEHQVPTAMKLICAGSNETIVGLHLIGDNADEILQGFAVAIKLKATKADFDNTIAIHPSSAEELVTMKKPS